MSKFQLILTGIFLAFILIGVLVFAFYRGSSDERVTVLIWGTISQEAFSQAFNEMPLSKDKFLTIRYAEKNPASFNQEFVEALASGIGPDVVLLSHEDILKNEDKIFTIPYESYSERDFKDTFIEEGELFLRSEGILALPVSVDPMVMYWNRDTFSNHGLSVPPAYWDEFYTLSQTLTQKDGALNIVRSTVALGEYENVSHAKDILAALMFQAGNPIVERNGTTLYSTLTSTFNLPIAPALAALTFYTEFSNPAKPFYSWNRSLPNSTNMFTAGDLAVYFGFASELPSIQLKNPNLNFDVAYLPQSRTANRRTTYGRLYAMAIVKNSPHVASAYTTAVAFSNSNGVSALASALRTPPVRRALLAERPSDGHAQVFQDSALWAKGWLDPDKTRTDLIFKDMIETITGGRTRLDAALNRAHNELHDLIRRQ